MENEITESTGNVFEDLGFEGGEAENLRVRARLMAPLERSLREQGITQAEAAEELGTTQARISELTNGKIQAFSIDALINMLDRAGLEVDVCGRRTPEQHVTLQTKQSSYPLDPRLLSVSPATISFTRPKTVIFQSS
ncbi:helix-turn-helix domain-containing protein [Salinibacter ruber]|uniref:helix-turn-helix domain-containing protein n=1 Tax=Salinibacter ruber TaxID=146919 RepID=UPI000E595152|nr:XRE family transcriptional regulator [Salinibacter ruber]